MELITILSVKDFPGLKDGTYTLGQDTIITGDYGTGKTSVLKAITYLFTGTDLDGHKIPGLTANTKVIGRGAIDITRTEEGASIGSLSNFIKGGVKYTLAKMIPGYLLGGAFTNKEIVEVLSGIEYNTFGLHHYDGDSIESLEEKIEAGKNINKIMGKFADAFTHYNSAIKYLGLKGIESDYKELTHFATFASMFFKYRRSYSGSIKYIVAMTDFVKQNPTLLKDNNKIISAAIKLKDDDLLVDIMQIGSNIHTLIWGAFGQPVIELSNLEHWMNTNYEDTVTKYLSMTSYKEKLGELKKEYFDTINKKLSDLGMSITNNNQLIINVLFDKEVKPLLALPRHKRFLYEVSLCSRMQSLALKYGLILIDDYMLQDDDDTLDSVLSEALAHQVILTKLDINQKTLLINID